MDNNQLHNLKDALSSLQACATLAIMGQPPAGLGSAITHALAVSRPQDQPDEACRQVAQGVHTLASFLGRCLEDALELAG